MKNPSLNESKRLTEKQRRFIACYTGNGVQAAREAGYSGNDQTLRAIAHENLTKPHILNAIRKRSDQEIEPLIAARTNRQEFWSKIMSDSKVNMRDRLRASELLAKSEGDFKDAVRVEQVIVQRQEIDPAEIREIMKRMEEEY